MKDGKASSNELLVEFGRPEAPLGGAERSSALLTGPGSAAKVCSLTELCRRLRQKGRKA